MSKKSKIQNIAKSPRATILDLLVLCDLGAYSNEVVPARLSRSKFSDPDKALITKVVYSTLRQQIRIDFALEKISSRKLKTLDPIARAGLRSVVCQLIDGFDMHAAVNETVKVLPFSLKGFVNAVSRKAIDSHSKGTLFLGEPDYVSYSLPKWIYNETQEVFGKKAQKVSESFNSTASVTLAPISTKPMDVANARVGELVSEARLLKQTGNLSDSPLLKSGDYIVSDQGSQLIAACLDLNGSEIVLDVCSAPGGKSLMMAKRAKQVFASDISPNRMERLMQSRLRVGASNVQCFCADALNLPFGPEQRFDRVLVDAPCSGLGVLRRRPDARHNITEKNVSELGLLQKEILESVIPLVATGGELIYSVCTFTKAETVEIDNWIHKNYPELLAKEIHFDSPLLTSVGRGYLLEGTQDNDSMYLLQLVKS